MIAPSARWSVWVQPESWVRTCSPPTTIWIPNSAAAPGREPDEGRVVALGPPGRRSRRRHDQPPTSAATQRCRTWAEVTSVSGRDERAAHQRPVGEDQRRVGRRDVRPEEQQRERREGRERRQQRESLAAPAAGRSGPGTRPGPSGTPAGRRAASRPSRWAVTDSPLLPRRTVSRPSQAWNPTSATAASDGQSSEGRSRWSTTARIARPRISKPMSAAIVRCTHSIQAFGVVQRGDAPGRGRAASPGSRARNPWRAR